MNRESIIKFRYRYWPDHLLGELLSKRWTETAVPVILLGIVIAVLSTQVSGLLSAGSLTIMSRQIGEVGLVVLGLSLVMIVGGIDLSLGSTFALCNLLALYLMHIAKWNVVGAVAATVALGAALGSINGLLIGYLRLRAFMTTLITLIVYRAAYDLLSVRVSTEISVNLPESAAWAWLGEGTVFGVPTGAVFCALVALFGHVFLTRLRGGWHITAIGGSRRSAYNSGIPVKRTVALTYVAAAVLTSFGAVFFASRLGSASNEVGLGLEVTALTAAVVGGISLGGGNGSVTKALIGTLVVLIITNGLISMSMAGGMSRMALAGILAIAALVDIRWLKNRQKIISKVYVSPSYLRLPDMPGPDEKGADVYAMNNELGKVDVIGYGQIEGPEDVILDRNDNLYCGTRHGDIVRFFAPDYQRKEVFAHIGGQPLGLAFDRHDHLYVCVGGMGLYRIAPDGQVTKATDETNRSWNSINDDSRLRLADDLDIAPDGRVFFSEATTRYEMHEWAVDSLEARGNGRILCYDPSTGKTQTELRNLIFPNGIAMCADGQSFLFAETWACRVSRYWFDGPKKGTKQLVIPDLPGLPDNINRASDGNFWVALTGMRTPVFDLALRMPGFRKRMAKRLPPDEWSFPNGNIGCVVKITEDGKVLQSLWDEGGVNHPSITSMREHKGHLYLGGLINNRIGRYKLEGVDAGYVHADSYWQADRRFWKDAA